MSTFEDEIRRAMAGHDDEAPRTEDLLRSLEQAPPRRRLAGWYGPLAAAAAVVAVVAGSFWGIRVLGHQATPAAAALTCPARYAKHAPWVPAKPAGVDGRSRLVPQQTPSSAVICGYAGSDEAKQQADWALSGRRALTGNLAGLAAQLSWQARLLPGHGYWCAGAGGPQTNYLIGLTYPGGGTIWVTATDEPGECIADSNGEFTSISTIGPQVSKAFGSGRWPARQPVSCNSASGRLGQDTAMVPAGATSVTICVTRVHRTVTSRPWSGRSTGYPLAPRMAPVPCCPARRPEQVTSSCSPTPRGRRPPCSSTRAAIRRSTTATCSPPARAASCR
jgi:hypothetical protein